MHLRTWVLVPALQPHRTNLTTPMTPFVLSLPGVSLTSPLFPQRFSSSFPRGLASLLPSPPTPICVQAFFSIPILNPNQMRESQMPLLFPFLCPGGEVYGRERAGREGTSTERPSLALRLQLPASKPITLGTQAGHAPPCAPLACVRLHGHAAHAHPGEHDLYSHLTNSFPLTVGCEGLTCPPPKNVSSEMSELRGLLGGGAKVREYLLGAPRPWPAASPLQTSVPAIALPLAPPHLLPNTWGVTKPPWPLSPECNQCD